MKHQKEGKVFFILAILIMLIGYQALEGEDFLTSAGVSKTTPEPSEKTTNETTTTKTVTETQSTNKTTTSTTPEKTTNDTPTEKTTTEPEPAPKTTNETTATKTTTETQSTEKTSIPTTTEKTSFTGKAITYPQNTTTTEEKVVIQEIITKPVEEESLLKTGTITTTKIVLENKGADTLTLIPALKIAPISLPHEESIARIVREKILEEDGRISTEELPHMIEQKVAGIKAIEKAKVKPLYIRKVYRPLETVTGYSVSDVTYTGQPASGELLFPRILNASTVILPPQEQASLDLEIREPLAIEVNTVNISLSSQGQEVLTKELVFPPSKTGTAIDLSVENHHFDLYVIINPDGKKPKEDYYVEIVLKKKNKVTYFELLGPYSIKNMEPQLFSQEFRYSPTYAGDYSIITTIYQNNHALSTQEQVVKLG